MIATMFAALIGNCHLQARRIGAYAVKCFVKFLKEKNEKDQDNMMTESFLYILKIYKKILNKI